MGTLRKIVVLKATKNSFRPKVKLTFKKQVQLCFSTIFLTFSTFRNCFRKDHTLIICFPQHTPVLRSLLLHNSWLARRLLEIVYATFSPGLLACMFMWYFECDRSQGGRFAHYGIAINSIKTIFAFGLYTNYLS